MARPRQTLGRGLDALLPPPRFRQETDDYLLCPLDRIQPDPDQPRQRFDQEALDELVRSIREKGIIQPLVARPGPEGYVLIAGERRLRAAQALRLETVPVVVKDVSSDEALELALIENLQREDLDPIEEAEAYRRLLERPGMTQDLVARRLGRNRTTITNTLRLLKLEREHQAMVVDGRLSAGHGRALLVVSAPEARRGLAERIVAQGLNVREAEQAARALSACSTPRQKRRAHALQPYADGVAQELSDALGQSVTVTMRGRKGRIQIAFEGIEALRQLRDRML